MRLSHGRSLPVQADSRNGERHMNNKRGGWGAKLLLVVMLMLASAVGGAYGYRVLDGKMAVSDAKKAVEDVDVSDYDTAEQTIIQGYIDDTNKDLDNAKTRKEVYDIIGDFISDVEKVQTKKDKELAEALKQAEDAKNRYNNQNDNTDNTGNNNNTSSGSSTDDGGNYKSNNLNQGSNGSDEDKDGFLGSLLGGLSSGSGN